MRLENSDMDALMAFLAEAGRDREDSEAWAHALVDLQESYEKIFNKLLPEAVSSVGRLRDSREVLWDIREELRHIEYHIQDVEGR